MVNVELKPCPFCGYPAVFEPFKEHKGYAATVRCCGCLAEITTITYDTEKKSRSMRYMGMEQEG